MSIRLNVQQCTDEVWLSTLALGQGSQVHGAVILQFESCTLCAGVRVCETKRSMYLINFGHIDKDLIPDKYDKQVMFPETRRYIVLSRFKNSVAVVRSI